MNRFWPSVTRTVGSSVIGLVVAGAIAAPAIVEASPILDQSQQIVSLNASDNCSSNVNTFTICGQSFTVGITGTLTSIDFYLSGAVGTPEAGLYDFSTASPTLLATSISPLTYAGAGYYSFAFSRPVVAGELLTFAFLSQSGDSISAPVLTSSVYAGGNFTGWVSTFGYVFGTDHDGAFRTYVDAATVPEPASLTLVAFGLVGLGARKWRQRKA